jgi:hypothetical protein
LEFLISQCKYHPIKKPALSRFFYWICRIQKAAWSGLLHLQHSNYLVG